MFIARTIEILKGIIFGFGPIIVIFVLYNLARGKQGKEIFYNNKEFSKSSIRNFLILIIFILVIIGGIYLYWQFLPQQNASKSLRMNDDYFNKYR